MKNQKQLEYLRKVYFKETYSFLNDDFEMDDDEHDRYCELISNEMVNFIWDYYKYLKTSPEELKVLVNQQASSKVYLNMMFNMFYNSPENENKNFVYGPIENLFSVVDHFTKRTNLKHIPGIDKDIVINYMFNVKNLFKDSKHIDKFITDDGMQDVCEIFMDGFIKKYFEDWKGLKELTGTLEGQWDLKWK